MHNQTNVRNNESLPFGLSSASEVLHTKTTKPLERSRSQIKIQEIVIPVALRCEMINRAHERHVGIAKSKARAKDVMWWPGMETVEEQNV